MINTKQKTLLQTEPVAVATVNSDGSPNVIAVMEVKVFDDTTIVITDNFMRLTKENILRDPRICLGVWTKDEGYKFVGVAQYFSEGKWIDFITAIKENDGYSRKGAIVVKVGKVFSLG